MANSPDKRSHLIALLEGILEVILHGLKYDPNAQQQETQTLRNVRQRIDEGLKEVDKAQEERRNPRQPAP